MIFNTEIAIAFKDEQGRYIKFNGTVFGLSGLIKRYHAAKIIFYRKKQIAFSVKCPICEEVHNYVYEIRDIVDKELIVGGCEKIGIPIFYIGKENGISDIIKKQHEVISDIQFTL